jgi:ribosomal protein L11 methyltransferase
MAFELLLSFELTSRVEAARIKTAVMNWLESRGRSDVVDGVIDGVDVPLTDTELAEVEPEAARFETAPVAIFDADKKACENILYELKLEFGQAIMGRITEISDESWQNCWHDSFEKFESNRFFFVPLGSALVTPDNLIRVELISRGGAFGTGQHATTRAVINVLEHLIQSRATQSMLDIGTGTGVYLVAAGLLGVKELAATEISEELVDVARENCEIAGVMADIRVLERPTFEKKYDLVVANILAPVLHAIMPDLVGHVSPSGYLVLAGFIDKEEGKLVGAAKAYGLGLKYKVSDSGWNCLAFGF